jgi:hypothetical protein
MSFTPQTAPCALALAALLCFAAGQTAKIYMTGGLTSVVTRDTFVYDGAGWSEGPAMRTNRTGHCSGAIGGALAGGRSCSAA